MPETKPREPETTAPTTGDRAPASAPGRTGDKTAKQDAPFVWPLQPPSWRARSKPCCKSTMPRKLQTAPFCPALR